GRGEPTGEVARYLSHSLMAWRRQRPHLRVRASLFRSTGTATRWTFTLGTTRCYSPTPARWRARKYASQLRDLQNSPTTTWRLPRCHDTSEWSETVGRGRYWQSHSGAGNAVNYRVCCSFRDRAGHMHLGL